MKRRDFLKILALGFAGSVCVPDAIAQMAKTPPDPLYSIPDSSIKDYLHKLKNFDKPHRDDIILSGDDYRIFTSVVHRLQRLQSFIGHGNFQILSFERGLGIARGYPKVGEFSHKEIEFMERIFYFDASRYGFYGHKPLENISDGIRARDVIKIRSAGNHLFRGKPLETYYTIKKELGDDVILTSGVRGIMKQFFLFLNKAYKSRGNLSLASRSLAPPGYSFHGTSDFDVGQVGFGISNFTSRFVTTHVYSRLSELGYLTLRYPEENMLGVRFEPWHIKL